ncbi:hypothetical protein LTR56_008567 [Elasticomyces elasticus]|nr:hypothetical protein LTR56_008567 [Elasticomyces elasticus]KAK3653302.1 hypothetical protein LTR22_011262 [Elasticomyces elasticus]KAK4918252.1 hypothetical protein LTR49_013951 [Elasticomyces elasticus]KAK5758361.1 hypothetical protein LTS12_011534 [Elasticomyces elasticus]
MSGQNNRTFFPRGYHDSGFHPRRIPVAEPHQIPVANLRPSPVARPRQTPVVAYYNNEVPDILLPTSPEKKPTKKASDASSMYSSQPESDSTNNRAQEAMGSGSTRPRSQARYEALLAEQQALAEDGEHVGRAEMAKLHELISRVRRELEQEMAPSRKLAEDG